MDALPAADFINDADPAEFSLLGTQCHLSGPGQIWRDTAVVHSIGP